MPSDLPDRNRDEDLHYQEDDEPMIHTLYAAARFLRRARLANDWRPVREVFADVLSFADADRICLALEAWPAQA